MSTAVIALNPKFRQNVGMIVRLCAAFDVPEFRWTGDRAQPEITPLGKERLPREERMLRNVVTFQQSDRALENFILSGYIPVAVENNPGFEQLPQFEHPMNAVYIFGPEDGDIPHGVLRKCHRFVTIPSEISLNLATAVSIILYDRRAKGIR